MPSILHWGLALPAVFVSASLAVGAGIGGGALFVAIYILVLGMDAHSAVPLSKGTIFGLALAAYSVNIWKKHPKASHKPLIDYDVALMLEPMTLLGTVAGVLLNVLFANWLVLLPLCLLLTVVTYKTFKKAISLHKKERAAAAASAAASPLSPADDHEALLEDDPEAVQPSEGDDHDRIEKLHALRAKESRLVPYERLLVLFLVWIGYFAQTYLLYRAHDVVEPCSAGWVVLLLAGIPYVCLVTYYSARAMLRVMAYKREIGYEFVEGDVRWDEINIYKWPSLAFFAGLAAAMMGIGGGMVKSPIMLSMGLLPQVTTTTSSFMIIFTASASTLQYYILGKIRGDELAGVMLTGFAGALLGQKVINHLVARSGRQSLLIFLLGGLTLVSVVLIVALTLAGGSFGGPAVRPDALCDA